MKLKEWMYAAAIIGAVAIYGIGQVAKSNREERDARLDAQAADDRAILNTCKEAAARSLGSPVLDWASSPYSRVGRTTTGYRTSVAADTGGMTHVFTCYIGDDMKSLQKITKE